MKTPTECKSCKLYWTGGITKSYHNMWCCKYGRPAHKAISHCRLKQGYEPKEQL
jgi:hypothetical protein